MSDDQFYILLEMLYNNIEDIRFAALVSREGLIVHSILEEGVSDISLAAITATLLSLGRSALAELRVGDLEVCILQGDEGNFVIMEVLWTGKLAIAVGTLPEGGEMKAHFAVFLEFGGGKIVAQRNYDCFEAW